MKLSDQEREFMRLVFEQTGAVPAVTLAELPSPPKRSASGFIELCREAGHTS